MTRKSRPWHGQRRSYEALQAETRARRQEAAEAYEYWLLTSLSRAPNGDGTFAIFEPMPPIVCTVDPPCGHCFYCRQRKAGKRA